MKRARTKARLRQSKDRFVNARGQTTRESLAKFLDKCRRRRLAKKARQQAVFQAGIHVINEHIPLVKRDKRKVVSLPGPFDLDLLAELTDEDQFLGPMRTAIIKKDVQLFNKLGAYMAQFWPKAAVGNDCVLIDNKLGIPKQLKSANLAALHRLIPGQAFVMDASEYI